jgi:hypothetical protein
VAEETEGCCCTRSLIKTPDRTSERPPQLAVFLFAPVMLQHTSPLMAQSGQSLRRNSLSVIGQERTLNRHRC